MVVRLSPEDIFKAVQNRGTRLPAMPTGLPTLPTTPRGVGGIDRAGMAAALAASGGRAAQQGAQRGGGGFGGFLGKVLGVIDMPRAILTSGVKEIKDAFDGEGFSWGDFTEQARTHYGFGDFLHDEDIDLGKWGNRAVGLAGDVLLDPFSWAGGLGAFARARGARGLVDDLAPLVKDLGELGVRDATQQATLRAAQDAVVAAGAKGGSVSRARNVLARQHGEVGKKLIDDLGIETGLRFRIPGTGPVLGRLTRGSAGIARKRASQIPRLVQERMTKAMGPDVDFADLVFKAQKRETLDQVPEQFRQVLQRAANVPVDVLPFGVFPIASGVTASIMSSPGMGWEKVASSRFGQTFRDFFVDPQKKYLDNLARGRGATDEQVAGRQKARDRKKVANSLLRTKDPDKIILGNFIRNSYNRGAMTSGYWADSAMRRRKIFLNEVQQNVGRIDDETLGRLTELSPELLDDFADGVVSPQVMDAVRGRFPGLSDEQIMFVVRRYDELIRTPDAEFLSRGDLYGSEGQLVNDMNDVMVDFGGYTPEIWTPDGLEIVRRAHGGDLPPWLEGVSREFEEVLPDARTMDEVRQRATSGRLRRRNMRPAGTRADGTFDGGTELVVPKADGSGSVRRLLRRSNPQRADVQQRVVGQGPDGRSTVIRRDLTPEELANRGRRPARNLTTEPEGLSVPEQIEAVYREAGHLDEGESLFVRGFEARENAHINSLAADIRLRSIESYAASQGLIYNADTYRGYARELADLEQAVADGNEVLRQLTDDEAAAQAVVDAITAVGASARAQTIENLEAWVARHGGSVPEAQARVDELTNLLGEGRVESQLLVNEVTDIVNDLQDILGYRRVATTPRVPGTDTTLGWLNSGIPFEDLVAAPPGANPVAFAIDAIRELAPILEDLDSVMVRARLLSEGVQKFAKLSKDIQNIGSTTGPTGLVIRTVDATTGAVDEATFLAGLQALDADIQASLNFLETDLIPFAASLSDSAMLHDQTVVAAEALRRATTLSGGTQNIDKQAFFNQVNAEFSDMGFAGGNSSRLHHFSDEQLRHPVDEMRIPPAAPGGPMRSTESVIMDAMGGTPAGKERARKFLTSIRTFQELHADVAEAIADVMGRSIDDVLDDLNFERIVSFGAGFDEDDGFDVSFMIFNSHSRRSSVNVRTLIPSYGFNSGTIQITNEMHDKARRSFGAYMDSMVLYEADRLQVPVDAGSIVTGGVNREHMVDSFIFGRSTGPGVRGVGGGENGLYAPFQAWRLPDANGEMQTIWKTPGLHTESKAFIRAAKDLLEQRPNAASAPINNLIINGDLVLPPAGPIRDAIEEIITTGASLGDTLRGWGEVIPAMVDEFESDFNRQFFYAMSGLIRSGNRPMDVGSYYGLKIASTADGNLGSGGAVRAADILETQSRRGGQASRVPTVPGQERGNQGRIFKRSGGMAVPQTLAFGIEGGMRVGPTPLGTSVGDTVAAQLDLLTELSDLENILNVNYLSNLLPANLRSETSGLTLATLVAISATRRVGLYRTAEQIWGTEGLQRYMPFLGQEPYPLPSAVGDPSGLPPRVPLPEMRRRLEDLQITLEHQISGRPSGALADADVIEVAGSPSNAGRLRRFAAGIEGSHSPNDVHDDLLTAIDEVIENIAYAADAAGVDVLDDFWDAWNRSRALPGAYTPGDRFLQMIGSDATLPGGATALQPGGVGGFAASAKVDDATWKVAIAEYRAEARRLGTWSDDHNYFLSLLDPDTSPLRANIDLYPSDPGMREVLSEYALVRVGDRVYNPAAVAVGGSAYTAPIPQQVADVIRNALDTGVGIRSNEYWDAIQSVLDNWGVPNGAFERGELIEWGYLVQQYDNLRAGKVNQATFMAEERLYGAFEDAIDATADEITRLNSQIATASDPAASQARLDARRITLAKKEVLVQKIQIQRNAMEQQILLAEQQRNDLANKIGTMLGPSNGKPFNLNSFGGQVDLSGVTAVQLQDLFNAGGKQMWGSGAMDEWLVAGNQEFADEFTYAMLAAQKMDDRVEVGNFLKAYDKAHNWLKAQMVATPGFVARNLFGGMTNMWFADIPLVEVPRTFRLLNKAYKAGDGDLAAGFRKLVADNPGNVEYANALELVQLGVHGGGQAASVVDVNLGRTSRMDWVWGSKENSKYSGRIRANPMDAGFFLFAGVRHANTFAEEAMRLGTGLHVRRVGGSIDDALEMTYKLHFNYGGLSEAERRFGKRVFPFYTWTRNNLPLQVSFLANSPGKFNRLMSLRRNIELGEEREGTVPDYFMEGFGLQLPFSIGGAQAYSQPDFPLQDLFRFDPTQRGYGKVMEQMFSSTTPFLKTPIEYWAGKRVFEGIPFREEYVPVPAATRMIPGLMQAAKALGWAKKNSKGEWMMYDNRLAVLDNMMPFIGRLRRVIPEDERTQSRWIQSMMSTLGGVSLRLNTSREQRNERIRRRVEREMTMGDRRDLERPRR